MIRKFLNGFRSFQSNACSFSVGSSPGPFRSQPVVYFWIRAHDIRFLTRNITLRFLIYTVLSQREHSTID